MKLIYHCILFPAVESYLAKSMAGQLGVTGEGTLLENAEGMQILRYFYN